MTKDSYGFIKNRNPQTLNLYSYCGNNPINMTDPAGSNPIKIIEKAIALGKGEVISLAIEGVSIVIEKAANNIVSGITGGAALRRAINQMNQMEELINNSGFDCGEIAEDLFNAAGEGKILRFEPENKFGTISVPESNHARSYTYHEVYSNGKYVLDLRFIRAPVSEKQYIEILNSLNSDNIIMKQIR